MCFCLLRHLDRNLLGIQLRQISSKMLKYPAAERNKEPILNVLKQILPNNKKLKALEIGSGSGQHISHFANYFSNIEWQSSEVDNRLFESIESIAKHYNLSNVLPPIKLDVSLPVSEWPTFVPQSYDIILCSNVLHITPWNCTLGLFEGSSVLLKDKTGVLITYGPFACDGILTPESNVNFDQYLRSQNPEWGVRDIQDLKQLAINNNLNLISVNSMPANNKLLVFKKV